MAQHQLCQHHRQIRQNTVAMITDQQGSPRTMAKMCPLCHQPSPGTIFEHQQEPVTEGEEGPEIVVKLRPAKFGDRRLNVMCPHCKELVTTELNLVDGAYVWYVAGCMLLMGSCLIIPWFCCCVPFIADKFKDVEHYCPKCGKLIHTYKRLDNKV